MWVFLSLLPALAAEPAPPPIATASTPPDPLAGVRPVPAPATAQADWRSWLAGHGKPLSELACVQTWPGFADTCFRVWEPTAAGKRSRRWVTSADLGAWGTTAAGLRDRVAPHAAERVGALAKSRDVVGMKATYLEIVDGDGWAAAAILAPEALAAKLGGAPIAVALPADTVALAWKPGDEQVDLAMAVGVHELFAAQESPVSEVIHVWDGKAWTAWAVATPKAAP